MKPITNIKIAIVLFVLMFTSCMSADYYLEESIFVSDPEIRGLPIYSEIGNNTYGIRLDRENIIYNEENYPIKFIIRDGVTSINFYGHRENNYQSDYTITINIEGLGLKTEAELMQLDGEIYDLESDNITVEILDESISDVAFQPELVDGEINFKRIQHLTIDEENKGVIFSGTFNFRAIIEDTPVAFSNGRFDVIIGYSNFYYIN